MPADLCVTDIQRGVIVAPAGCGKTQLIANGLTRSGGPKKTLVLTHTNAGVAALKSRLNALRVPASRYTLLTLDAWVIRLLTQFPQRSGIDIRGDSSVNYVAWRKAIAGLLRSGDISELLFSTYERLLVDEYQDCSTQQHAIVSLASCVFPTCVLGDPLQAIFNFDASDPLPSWNDNVCQHFPVVGQLGVPWRWKKAGSEAFGNWLLGVREVLVAGGAIDIRTAPPEVRWIQLDGINDVAIHRNSSAYRGGNGSVLILGDMRNADSRHAIASGVPGLVSVEAVDMGEFVRFASTFDVRGDQALVQFFEFVKKLAANTHTNEILERLRTLDAGTARKGPSSLEQAAMAFKIGRSWFFLMRLLEELEQQPGFRAYRVSLFRALKLTINMCASDIQLSFSDAAIRVRERMRTLGRPVEGRAIGSTLLMKGLEAETAIVHNAHLLTRRNLYVAMTRGSREVHICSPTPILNPVW